MRKSFRVAQRLRCGLTWVNCHHRNDPSSPWGGFGQSGIGRENGPEAFEEYTTTKSLTIRRTARVLKVSLLDMLDLKLIKYY